MKTQTLVLSGDKFASVARVANEVGITEGAVHAELRPQEKAQFILSLQEQGYSVAMVRLTGPVSSFISSPAKPSKMWIMAIFLKPFLYMMPMAWVLNV